MKVEDTIFPDVKVLTPRRFGDDRGWFSEVWNARAMSDAGIAVDFVQDNQSLSRPKGTLRGLHYQAPPHAQGKLVRCLRGGIWDVVVDVRKDSAQFGQWLGIELTPEAGSQLWVPGGFLHGFVTLRPDTEVAYKCTDYYATQAEGSVRWDSATLGIDWRLDGPPDLSPKDANAPEFDAWDSPFSMEAAR